MQILSSFTHAKVVPDLPYYGEKKYYMEVYQQLFGKQQFWEHLCVQWTSLIQV